MKEKTEDVERLKDDSNSWKVWRWVCAVSVVVLLLVSGYVYMFWSSVGAILPTEGAPDIREQYALLGDAFGWVIGSLFSFVSIVLLIITLRQNQKVLKVNSEELELSRIELGRSAQELELSREELHRSAEALENQLVQSDVQHLTAVVLEMLKGYRGDAADKPIIAILENLLMAKESSLLTSATAAGSSYDRAFKEVLELGEVKVLTSQVENIYAFIHKFSDQKSREKLLFLVDASIDNSVVMMMLMKVTRDYDSSLTSLLKSLLGASKIQRLCLDFLNVGSSRLRRFVYGIDDLIESDIDQMVKDHNLDKFKVGAMAVYICEYRNVLTQFECSTMLTERLRHLEVLLERKCASM